MIERQLVNQECRVHEFAIGWLSTVLDVRIERVHRSLCASGLNDASRPEVPAESQIILQSNAIPIIQFQSHKSGVVIAMPETCGHGDVALDLPAACHRADGEVESRRGSSCVQISPEIPNTLGLKVAELVGH